MLTVSGIASVCPVTGTALPPTLSSGVHVGLPSGTVRVSYNFVYISCPHVLRDCCIPLFCLWFCYYTTILRGNDREAIVSAGFLQLADTYNCP